MEDYSFHSHGSLTQLAELRGCFKYMLYDAYAGRSKPKWFKFFTAPVTSVKKIASGNGRATKEMMHEGIQRFGYVVDGNKDDMIDAMSIVLSTFYAIYFRLFGLEFPECKNAKERNFVKSWKKSLTTFADRIGRKEEIEKWIT